ncbi:MAG: 4-alpha-glucanotransferase, partial [Stomatobaculum sp.]|nr:4-alpha-glucanotransferase [Stomatobaculum sp.]
MKRACGVLLPVFSLPGNYGIGSFSVKAYEFVDTLRKAEQTYWQILPLGPTGFGDSPYQSFSSFAGNPYLIDLDELVTRGLLDENELKGLDWGGDPRYVDYGKQWENKD